MTETKLESAASQRLLEPFEGRPQWLNERLGGVTGKGIRVAVVDSGYDQQPRSEQILPGRGLVPPESGLSLHWSRDDLDHLGHGTAACDIVLGMAPDVEIVPLRVFGRQLETSPSVIVAALEWATEHGIDVVNLSLGSESESAKEPLYRACEKARQASCLVVSAVPHGTGPVYPAVFDNSLSVTAGNFGNIHDFAYKTSGRAEFVAQGERRLEWRGEPSELRGSSLAAPHITAIVALLRESFPGADLETVRRLLIELSGAAGGMLQPTARDRGPEISQECSTSS